MNLYSLSDNAIIEELGNGIKQLRLRKNISQEELSERCGLHRVTISKIESGHSASLLSFVQLMRGLNELERLKSFLPEEQISPLEIARREGKKRQKASGKRSKPTGKKQSEW